MESAHFWKQKPAPRASVAIFDLKPTDTHRELLDLASALTKQRTSLEAVEVRLRGFEARAGSPGGFRPKLGFLGFWFAGFWLSGDHLVFGVLLVFTKKIREDLGRSDSWCGGETSGSGVRVRLECLPNGCALASPETHEKRAVSETCQRCLLLREGSAFFWGRGEAGVETGPFLFFRSRAPDSCFPWWGLQFGVSFLLRHSFPAGSQGMAQGLGTNRTGIPT